MAEVFGDEVDPHEVLGQHPHAKEKLEDGEKQSSVAP